MVVGNSEIKALSLEERQMIYDALVHYMFSESEMARSNHFAKDIHADIADKVAKMAIQMRESWKDVMH